MELLNGEAEITLRGVFNCYYKDKHTDIESDVTIKAHHITAKATIETDDASDCLTVLTLSNSFYCSTMGNKTDIVRTKETVEEINNKIKKAFEDEKEANLALLKMHRIAAVV